VRLVLAAAAFLAAPRRLSRQFCASNTASVTGLYLVVD